MRAFSQSQPQAVCGSRIAIRFAGGLYTSALHVEFVDCFGVMLDLRAQHLSLDVTRTSSNAYGVIYEIEPDQDTQWQDGPVLLNLADRHWH